MAARDRKEALLEKVRRIHIRSRSVAAEFMAGQYSSAFRGTGMEFHEVRTYQAGDPVERIDWNVTARTGMLHVKTFIEEREQCVLFLVDTSASTAFGTIAASKSETLAELCALLGYSALSNHNRVGLLLFSDRIEKFIPPRRGVEQGRLLIHALLSGPPGRSNTSIRTALLHLMRMRQRRAIVFLVSDFLDSGYEEALGLAARQHDLIALRVWDPGEKELKGHGIACFHDLETGADSAVDLGSRSLRKAYSNSADLFRRNVKAICISKGVDLLEVESGRDPLALLRSFFEQRIRRRTW